MENSIDDFYLCLRTGNLLASDAPSSPDNSLTHLHLATNDNSDVALYDKNDILALSGEEYQLLAGIKSPAARLTFANEPYRLASSLSIHVGDQIHVLVRDTRHSVRQLPGRVAYVGQLPRERGVKFGVILSPPFTTLGTSDGEFSGKRFFHCAQDGAVFVSVEKLCGSPIHFAQRVAWVSEKGEYHSGVVKWLGKLEGLPDLFAGVHFDKPVPQGGAGDYRGHTLFRTPHGHALLLAVCGLLPEDALFTCNV